MQFNILSFMLHTTYYSYRRQDVSVQCGSAPHRWGQIGAVLVLALFVGLVVRKENINYFSGC